MSVETTPRDAPTTTRTPAAGRRPGSRRARFLGTITGVALALLVGLLVVSLLPRAGSAPASGDQAGDPAAAAGDAAATAAPPGDAGYGGTVAAKPAAWERPVVDAGGLADRLGVRISTVAITGGGGLLDLRVQVLDPNKADGLHDDEHPPALIDDATNVVASNLLMGHSHSAGFTAGVTYYYIFENPGNIVQRGGAVSVLLGNTEIDDIPVN